MCLYAQTSVLHCAFCPFLFRGLHSCFLKHHCRLMEACRLNPLKTQFDFFLLHDARRPYPLASFFTKTCCSRDQLLIPDADSCFPQFTRAVGIFLTSFPPQKFHDYFCAFFRCSPGFPFRSRVVNHTPLDYPILSFLAQPHPVRPLPTPAAVSFLAPTFRL